MNAPAGMAQTPQKSFRSRLVVHPGFMVSRSSRQVKFPTCRSISILAFSGSNAESSGESCQASPAPLPVVCHQSVEAPFGR